MSNLNEFTIVGLWGERNYKLLFKDNKLIIVGENGSGKTTILRILYYSLAGKWGDLAQENFKRIEIKIDGVTKSFTKEQLEDPKTYNIDLDSDLMEKLPLVVRRRIMEQLNAREGIVTAEHILDIINELSIPYVNINEEIAYLQTKVANVPDSIKEISDWLVDNLKYQILYMPTYRRIEQKPGAVVENYANPRLRRGRMYGEVTSKNMEVSHIGMRDIQESIRNMIDIIRQEYNKSSVQLNLECFKGILTQDFESVSKIEEEQANPEYIEMIFNSVSNNDLLEQDIIQIKDKLLKVLDKKSKYDEYDKIVIYFYIMLTSRFEKLKKIEEKLEHFFYACNQYLGTKQFVYIPNEFNYILEVKSHNGEKREMSIEKLSSGEKQIVALFSYLYLFSTKSIMVIIDEPELSLSVSWQEKVLQDIAKSEMCGALITATQSPFVYDNDLREYAHAIEEFLVLE